MNDKYITIHEAAIWVSNYINKPIKESTIRTLIKNNKIQYKKLNKKIVVDKESLAIYYSRSKKINEIQWSGKLSEYENRAFLFLEYSNSDSTKHVHKLHPYKGKYNPQLVEYFLDKKTDRFKTEIFFNEDDIILEPFCGSGTTLIQANELNINCVGIDISEFNTNISNVKISNHNIDEINKVINNITKSLHEFINTKNVREFDKTLTKKLKELNSIYFNPDDVKTINVKDYAPTVINIFDEMYNELCNAYNINLNRDNIDTFLTKWYMPEMLDEIKLVSELINEINNPDIKLVIQIILSRTLRSCRATPHAQLSSLRKPIYGPYYCKKHNRICRPIFSIESSILPQIIVTVNS